MQICFNARKCPMLRRQLPYFQRLLWSTGYWVRWPPHHQRLARFNTACLANAHVQAEKGAGRNIRMQLRLRCSTLPRAQGYFSNCLCTPVRNFLFQFSSRPSCTAFTERPAMRCTLQSHAPAECALQQAAAFT